MRTNSLQCCSSKCVLSIFIYNTALQNTDFGVLQKSSKHFLIYIFFPPFSFRTPPPPPPLKKIRTYFVQLPYKIRILECFRSHLSIF